MGGVIYAERAPLQSPLTVPARCSEPEGAQLAGERVSERASLRALGAGFSRGAPGRCLLSGRSSPRSSEAGEEQEANEESRSGAGRARGGDASPTLPPPVQAWERSLTARRPRARHPGPRLPQGWSKSLRGARCSTPLPGSPPPTDCSRLLARPAQAGEVSCARRLAREPAGGRSKLEASGPWTGAGEAPAAARDGGTCCACWHCSQAVCSQCAGRASTPTTGQ